MVLSPAAIYKAKEAGRARSPRYRGGGNEAPTAEEGSLEAQKGTPPGGIMRGSRLKSRPIRITGRTGRRSI